MQNFLTYSFLFRLRDKHMSNITISMPCPQCGDPLIQILPHNKLVCIPPTIQEGGYYCAKCPPQSAEHVYRFFKALQVAVTHSSVSLIDQVMLESLDCGFVDGCAELSIDLHNLTSSTVNILQAVWLKARHNIPPEKKPADMRALLGIQSGVNALIGSGKDSAEIVHFFLTSDVARADYKSMYESLGGCDV